MKVNFVRAEANNKTLRTIGAARPLDPIFKLAWAQDFETNLGGTIHWTYTVTCHLGEKDKETTFDVTGDQEVQCTNDIQ